jgi:Fe-S cluster assembly iron-binding protein IscA
MKRLKPIKKPLILLMFTLLWGAAIGQNYMLESFDDVTFPPTGWTQTQVSGTGLWNRSTSGFNPTCSPQSGAGMIRFNSFTYDAGTSAVLTSSSINLSGITGLKLQLWFFRDNMLTSNLDVADFYINTTNSLSGAYFLGSIYRPITSVPIESASGWYSYNFDIPASYDGSENYIIIKGTSQKGRSIFIDEVRIYKPVAANNSPINFSVSGVSQSEMTVFWDDNSTNEVGFRVYISTDGTNYTKYGSDILTTTQSTTGTQYSQAITGLLPGTTYYFRISAYVDAESAYLTGSQETLPAGIITSAATGNWNDPATWDPAVVPTSTNDVVIANGHTVTVNATGSFNNLTVNGSLAFGIFTLSGKNVTISETGSISVTPGTTANLSTSGNVTNNGTFDFFVSDTQLGRVTFTGTSSQTFDAIGTTDLGNVTVNKGSSYSQIAEIAANGTFSIKGGAATNFLTLTNGTLKISGTATVSSNVFASGGYTISATSGFWLYNPNFTVLGTTSSATINGYFRLTNGTYSVGNSSLYVLGAGAGSIIVIEGGTLNLSSRFYTTNAINYTQSGGAINVNTLGNSTTNASFGLISTSNTINISGGDINLVNRNTNASPLDYSLNGSTLNITGGTLNIGTAATGTNFDFRIQGTTPNLVVDNTTNAKTALLSAATTIRGNITVNTGSILNLQTSNLSLVGNPNQVGSIVNNGLITNTSATGSNRFSFVGAHGLQTISGSGTFGNATTPMAGVIVSNASGVKFESAVVTNRVNLITGIVLGANYITLGNGVASSPVVQRGGTSSVVVGSFDQAPAVSAGSAYGVLYSTGLSPYTTGFELPASLAGTLELASNVDVTFGATASIQKLKFAASNTGKLVTSNDNLLTITGTPADVTIVAGNTGYIQGPLAYVLPLSLATGSTYIYPIGKGSANHFELVNPTTSAGGSVVVKAKVLDAATGGTTGADIQPGSLGSRYWNAEITSGAENLINTSVRVTQTSPALLPQNALAQSATLTGEYNLASSTAPASNTIISNTITELGYFAIGIQEPPVGGSVTGGTAICTGSTSGELTLIDYFGDIVRWESSVSPFTVWDPIANTINTYTSDVLSETTRFRAVLKTGVYDEVYSEYAEVVVNPATVGGIIEGAAPICSGFISGLLTLTGYTGDVVRWEQAVSPFTDWVTIENTLDTYTSDILTETTYFRAVIKSGVCTEVESDVAIVTVKPIPNPEISSANPLSYCANESISTLFVIDITGDSYQWLLNSVEIDLAAESTYTATEAGAYYVEVTIDGCTGQSNEIAIVSKPLPEPTVQTLDNLIYCGEVVVSTLFTVDILADSYKWLLNGTEILDATTNTYTATEIGIFSVEVTVDGCIGISNELEIVSNPIPVPIISTLSNLVYCENEVISVDLTIDITGNTYQWLLNSEIIQDATLSTYTTTQAGLYSVEVTTDGCTGISNEIEVTVNPLPVAVISTTDNLVWTIGDDISVTFTVDITADFYQWLLNGNLITAANDATYTATEAGVYSVEVTVGNCTGTSNELIITANPPQAYTITFLVTALGGVPVSNVAVVIEGQDDIYTNDEGYAVINLPNGLYYFWVVLVDHQEFSSNFTVNGEAMLIPVDLISGLDSQNSLLIVNSFPNPFDSEIRFSNSELVTRVDVSNIIGQIVISNKIDGVSHVNTSALPAGVYLVKFTGKNGESITHKMIKK